MKKNQIIRLVCFFLCIIIVAAYLSQIFHYDKAHMRNRLYTYTQLEENTVDAVIIGTSGIHCFWIPGRCYDETGITMYNLTTNGMQAWHILPMIKYAYKYHNPKLVCVDMRPFVVDGDGSVMEYRARYFHEILPIYSPLRVESTYRSLKYMSRYTDTSRFDLSYFFCILRYHDMWQNDLDFKVLEDEYMESYGYLLSKRINDKAVLKESEESTEKEPLVDFAQECLDELIDYAEKHDIELLFVDTPRYIDEQKAKRINTLHDYLDSKGIRYFDCTTKDGLEEHPFDRENDFYDQHHANYYGATKFTSYLGKYLSENYDLPDRREDEKCNVWAEDYKKTLKTIEKKYKIKTDW